MTSQRPDVFRIDGVENFILGLKGGGFNTAQDLGLEPLSVVSNCQRGYVMKYDCVKGQLILDGMEIHLKETVNVNDVEPELVLAMGGYKSIYYEGLGLKTKFSGKILLANDFLGDEKPWEFQPPTQFRKIIEIEVHNGKIVKELDHSASIEELRKQRAESDIVLSFEQVTEEDMTLLGYDVTSDLPKW
jgi:hypothetical protein